MRLPVDEPETWEFEPEDSWGILATPDGEQRIPSAQGQYEHLYIQFRSGSSGRRTATVPASEGVRTLVLLNAARAAAAQGRTVVIPTRTESRRL